MIAPRRERDSLAASITRKASKQTFYMIRLFVDRDLIPDAFRAYAYFRWVDDFLDAPTGSQEEKITFARRQRGILDDLYQGITPLDLYPPEELLVDLVRSDPSLESGLYLYLDNMMDVMEFDAQRCGREISQDELDNYTNSLAISVTEAMHYYIDHDHPGYQTEDRYLAVKASHIAHMLRDELEDALSGYYNIPRHYLKEHQISAFDVQNPAFQKWVFSQVNLSREYFKVGRAYLSRLKSIRCRLAGFAYVARFEWVLNTIERENFCLRLGYPERKSFSSALWMIWSTLKSIWISPRLKDNTKISISPSNQDP